ncbi:MAG: putative transcriptional regulator for fatty acid degradation FadP, TetR family [Rhodanobacteraceae bacterium]|jgi:AcrR family transcriptional regulator|nr:MAG: putative transcriptional regulator for fatty acid degradation FadP, TetR family [Rhodanobacteraceae bacterium]
MILAAATAKGVATRSAIVERAIEQVRKQGLESLSIGGLAQAAAMSKSGVFAHFGSREDLQLAVLDAVAEDFSRKVLQTAFRQPRGVRRLRAILSGWMDWTHGAGCPMIAAVIEYDDRPGAIRDRVVHWQRRLREALTQAVQLAIETGELRRDTDAAQVAFEMFGIVLALHHDTRLFRGTDAIVRASHAFDRLMADHAT